MFAVQRRFLLAFWFFLLFFFLFFLFWLSPIWLEKSESLFKNIFDMTNGRQGLVSLGEILWVSPIVEISLSIFFLAYSVLMILMPYFDITFCSRQQFLELLLDKSVLSPFFLF